MPRKTWSDISAYMISEHSGWERERGLGKVFLGRIVVSMPQSVVETNRQAFEPYSTNYWPGLASPTLGDPCIDEYHMEREHPGRPGCSRITLIYRKAKLLGQLDTALKALVYVDVNSIATKVLVVNTNIDSDTGMPDPDDPEWATIEGPEQNPTTGDDYITEWRIVKGSNEILAPNLGVLLKVAYNTVPFNAIYDTVGKWHTGTAPFGGAFSPAIQPKHLLYRGAKAAMDVNRHGKWIVDHYFETSDVHYDVDVTSEAFIKRVVEVPMKRLGGGGFEATGQKSRIIAWESMLRHTTVDIHRGYLDFGDTDGILAGLTYLNAT